MRMGRLGKEYELGEIVVRQGEYGNEMYVVLSGEVEVIRQSGEEEIPLATLGKGQVFGEMALLGDTTRSATVRVKSKARILTVDKKGFLKKVHEDPSFVFNILQMMSDRIREMDKEIARLKAIELEHAECPGCDAASAPPREEDARIDKADDG
ncbi:hypothetical protein AMJ39_09755 [candidate division TA06 bacterium DG_24]|uniref:Cyclic nucleotide-binding domain-containing protein n=2 Tax=Bacteria division TA06 TaxID=1156500 RepID=A0A0S8JFN6_UNCT6|nr:MAG: hypothetical protein AMJ39_09755 [candidate division TA06 bacterium DG_24]KPL08543.1 MAG: hypothetical protein AMJ71_08230 [candidate division TA06 bacterium SM1_40]